MITKKLFDGSLLLRDINSGYKMRYMFYNKKEATVKFKQYLKTLKYATNTTSTRKT